MWLAATLLLCAALQAAEPERQIAMTLDDLPWARLETITPADLPARHAALMAQLRRGYVPYMLNKLDYYERQSQALLGRNIAHVWLLHANELNAATYAGLVAAAQRRGYRFIGLQEALRDPAYARGAEGYNGCYGPSWLHRWAMAEKQPKAFYQGEPRVPRWVMQLARQEGE